MTTKTIKVISDIHGCADEFSELLRVANYNPDHDQLILLGDYVDRGPNSRGVVEHVMKLVREYGVVALGGNHEDLFLKWLQNHEAAERYLREVIGGIETIQSFCEPLGHQEPDAEARRLILEAYPEQIEFLHTLPDSYEAEGHIFVHAGIDPLLADWRETPSHTLRWIRGDFHHTKHQADGTVVFGHTPTTNLHESETCAEIWHGDRIIGIDGGCVFGNQLNCLEISPNGYRSYSVARKGM